MRNSSGDSDSERESFCDHTYTVYTITFTPTFRLQYVYHYHRIGYSLKLDALGYISVAESTLRELLNLVK